MAIGLGLFGSLHCVGMCGPILSVLPYHRISRSTIHKVILYHTGRWFGYLLILVLFQSLAQSLAFVGLQEFISVFSGILLIVIGFGALLRTQVLSLNRFISLLGKYLQKQSQGRVYHVVMMGFLNGLLPCGYVYVAAAAAVSVGTFYKSMGFMLLFGIGTLPALLGLGVLRQVATRYFKISAAKWLPWVSLSLGVLLVVRGLELDIPYMSPIIEKSDEGIHSCH